MDIDHLIIKHSTVTDKVPEPEDLSVGELAINTADGLAFTKHSDGTIVPIGGGGATVMADITDKQGKVLDDLIVIEDYSAEIDTLFTPGGYIVKVDLPINGFYSGATILVASNSGIVTQTIMLPIFSKIGVRYHDGSVWTDWVFCLAPHDVKNWYVSTTAEPPNAVLNANGSFSRSLANVVTGPANAVDGALAAFDGPSGGQIKDGEAPSDGKTYGRKDAQWVEVTSGGGGSTAWADITGKPAVIGAGETITAAQAAMGIVVSPTAPVSPAEGTIWIKVA